jgi:hypothetical protein
MSRHALAALSAGYEHLEDLHAGRLELRLFEPVQRAYGRATRARTDPAERL